MALGADVPASSSAGDEDALTMRWQAFIGIANSEPFCHSNMLLLAALLPDFGRAAALDHENCSSYRCRSTLSAPAPGTSTT